MYTNNPEWSHKDM